MDISILIGLKNNLDYSKASYANIRKLYPEVEICLVSYFSDDGTYSWLDNLKQTDQNVKIFYETNTDKSFGDTYNQAAKLATKKYIVFLHNDIIVCSNFLENVLKHLSDHTIVTYTTIEPDIFGKHERPGKIIKNFGYDLFDFNQTILDQFVEQQLIIENNQIYDGVDIFCAMSKNFYFSCGGFDPLFYPFFYEDKDLLKRLKLLNAKTIVSKDALCYHFVSKTSRFSKQTNNTTCQHIEQNNQKNYIRKWGSLSYDQTYEMSIVIHNANLDVISAVEPYATDKLYTDAYAEEYVQLEQLNTKFDLRSKIFSLKNGIPNNNHIMIYIDANNISQIGYRYLCNIQNIISQINKVGKFNVENIQIHINKINNIALSKIKK